MRESSILEQVLLLRIRNGDTGVSRQFLENPKKRGTKGRFRGCFRKFQEPFESIPSGFVGVLKGLRVLYGCFNSIIGDL